MRPRGFATLARGKLAGLACERWTWRPSAPRSVHGRRSSQVQAIVQLARVIDVGRLLTGQSGCRNVGSRDKGVISDGLFSTEPWQRAQASSRRSKGTRGGGGWLVGIRQRVAGFARPFLPSPRSF